MNNVDIIKNGHKKRQRRSIIVSVVLLLITLLLCICVLVIGNTRYSLKTIFDVLMGASIEGATFTIKTLRWPRMLAGLFSGFAFGIAGDVFQTMFRNPLSNPNIMGITSGSSAAAVFCIVILHSSGVIVSTAAVLMGMITAIVIYFLANRGNFSTGRIVLIGIGIQAIFNSVISYLLLKASQYDIPTAMRWLTGSLNGAQINNLIPLFIATLIVVPILIFGGKNLQILELGDQTATALGLRTNAARIFLLMGAVVLASFATAATGPIAFVSFLAAPIAKRLIKNGYPSALASGFVGAILVIGADLIGQWMFSTRFPVGIITGIVGAPYLLLLLITLGKKGEM